MNGYLERYNSTAHETLAALVSSHGKDWAGLCPAVQFAIRTTESAATGRTSFWLNTGRYPRLPTDIRSPPLSPDDTAPRSPEAGADAFYDAYSSRIIAARDALYRSQERIYRTLLREHTTSAPEFKTGDLAMLSTKNLKLHCPQKFKPRYIGPSEILAVRSNAYQLRLPARMRDRRIHDWFNFDLLKRFHARPPHLGPAYNLEPPPLDDPEHPPPEIDSFEDHIAESGCRFFLVDLVTDRCFRGSGSFWSLKGRGVWRGGETRLSPASMLCTRKDCEA